MPLIVIVLLAHAAVTPAGRPVAAPIPVAPVVVRVIGVKDVLIQSVGFDDTIPTLFTGLTIIVPIAFKAPQPPVKGIV